MGSLIFEGVKILELGWAGTEPIGTRFLSDYGATTILVENHVRPAINRVSGPMYRYNRDFECFWWHTDFNCSKYGITLNLWKPKAFELIKRFVMEWQPNVFTDAFRPDVMERMGISYETVKQWKPDIIYYSTCLMGQYGPHRRQLGYGTIPTQCGGPSYLTGWPDRGPVGQFGAYSDFPNSAIVTALMTAALLRQRRTGKGMYIDHSQYEALMQFFSAPIMDYFITGRVMNRDGNRLPYAAPHGVYPCKGDDRWVAIAVFTDEEWKAFCQVIGNPEWTKDPRFATLIARKQNEDELERLVAEWTKDFIAEQVEAMMQASGVAAHTLLSGKDIFDDPQIKHYNHFREFDHPTIGPIVDGKIRVEGPSMKFSKSTDRTFRAPMFGEHNQYVFKEFLGLSDDDIADLIVEGVITTEIDLPQPPERKGGA